MAIRIEQINLMNILDPQPNPGGEELHETLPLTTKTKLPKKSTSVISKYKVNVNGIVIHGIIDYVRPSAKDNFWTFYASDGRFIEASGGVIVEKI